MIRVARMTGVTRMTRETRMAGVTRVTMSNDVWDDWDAVD